MIFPLVRSLHPSSRNRIRREFYRDKDKGFMT